MSSASSLRHLIMNVGGMLMLIVLFASTAGAQWTPSKPVDIYVTFGQGSQADIAARLMADVISKSGLSDQPFRIVNVPAGAGLEAFNRFQQMRGDNHALMLILPNAFTLPLYNSQVRFDVMTTTPIAGMGLEPLVLWVHSDRSDIATIDDLVVAARAKGKDFKIYGPALGTPRALLAEMIMSLYSLPVTYVVAKGLGSTAKILADKTADATLHNPSEQEAVAQPGINKPVAVLSDRRLDRYPLAPTFRETGMDISYHAIRCMIGAPGMAREAQAFYSRIFEKVYGSAEWQAFRSKHGLIGAFVSDEPLRQLLLRENEKHVRWKMAIEAMRNN